MPSTIDDRRRGSRRTQLPYTSASRPAVSCADPPRSRVGRAFNSERDVALLQERLELLVVRVNECSSDVSVHCGHALPARLRWKSQSAMRIVGPSAEHLLAALEVPLDCASSIA